MELAFIDIITTIADAILLLVSFIVLNSRKNFIKENKLKSVIFCISVVVFTRWSTVYIPGIYHSVIAVAVVITLLNYIGKITIFTSIITVMTFNVLVLFTEASVSLLEMAFSGLSLDALLKNVIGLTIGSVASKTLEAIILLILWRKKVNFARFRIFRKEGSIFSFFILQTSVFGILILSVNSGGINTQNLAAYNIFIVVLFLIFTILSLIDFRERERIIKINNKFIIQEQHIENMKTMMSIIRQEKHEFANHVNVIGVLSALNKSNLAEKIADYVNSISSQMNSSFKEFDTGNEYIDGILSIKNNIAFQRNILLDVVINKRLDVLHIKADELISIISNLIDNAFDAMQGANKDNMKISLVTYNEDNYFYINIANNGPKIPDSIKNKIFEKGFSTKKEDKDNHGYGLYIVKELTEKNNGTISVKSSEDETVFSVKLKCP